MKEPYLRILGALLLSLLAVHPMSFSSSALFPIPSFKLALTSFSFPKKLLCLGPLAGPFWWFLPFCFDGFLSKHLPHISLSDLPQGDQRSLLFSLGFKFPLFPR